MLFTLSKFEKKLKFFYINFISVITTEQIFFFDSRSWYHGNRERIISDNEINQCSYSLIEKLVALYRSGFVVVDNFDNVTWVISINMKNNNKIDDDYIVCNLWMMNLIQTEIINFYFSD